MKANNLTWEQIKELAEMALKNKCDFSLDTTNGDMNVCITQTDDPKFSKISLTPSFVPCNNPEVTWVGTSPTVMSNASDYTISAENLDVDGSELEW